MAEVNKAIQNETEHRSMNNCLYRVLHVFSLSILLV